MTDTPEKLVLTIRRKTRKKHHPEEKIRIVPEGLRGEESIASCVATRPIKAEHNWHPVTRYCSKGPNRKDC